MTAVLNYILEANLVLLITLAFYMLFLKGETNFRLMRAYLLLSIFASLAFPLMDVQFNASPGTASPLSIGRVIPTYWLPEVTINGEGVGASANTLEFWRSSALVYAVGLFVFCIIVVFQLFQLFRIIRSSKTYRIQKLRIAESSEKMPTFSFFNFIFIGQANELSGEEKQDIIRHESVHARQWHSFDILLINVLRVLFWFNPFINTYKKNFIQLHEFEADARAVENSDVDKYCSLLARVALQSADFKLANHFNNSLTVKRIEMMRTIKNNIRRWKVVAIATVLPLVFFFVACQDQVADDITEIARNSTHALIVPEFVQQRMKELKDADPNKKYTVLELNETGTESMKKLQSMYGLPKSVEVFTAIDGKVVEQGIKGEAAGVMIEKSKAASGPQEKQTFAIVEFNEDVRRASETSAQEKIYTVVEENPEFIGGYTAMMDFIKTNMRYPADARTMGVEGTVYVKFIVWADGTVSDVSVIRGINETCDREAMRVVEMFPDWKPGKQSGQPVSVSFVLPIKFKLG